MAVTVIGNKLQVEVLADESTKTQLNEIQQEIIDARQGETTLGLKIDSMDDKLGKNDTEGIIITVKQDGSGDFTNISNAVASITNSSLYKKIYDLYI